MAKLSQVAFCEPLGERKNLMKKIKFSTSTSTTWEKYSKQEVSQKVDKLADLLGIFHLLNRHWGP
jgi:hypothetical protein